MMSRKGYLHSIESFGTLDGPGIRYVLFMQGCPLRCAYCHNPDTWQMRYGREVTVEEIIADVQQYLPYLTASGGGVTASGGEPLLQAAFLSELFEKLHKLKVHTALDTSGYADVEKVVTLLQNTDLVLLSVKHTDPLKHQLLTEHTNYRPLRLARYLTRIRKPVWIRYVLVPSLTDSQEDLAALADLVNTMPNVQRLEVLPYHDLGVAKWQALGLTYQLSEISPPTEQQVDMAQSFLRGRLPASVSIC